MTSSISADFKRDMGHGNWEGEAPAEPKRQRMANSDWRMMRQQ
ncbi:hypothetical protein [Fervidibacter sacchari]